MVNKKVRYFFVVIIFIEDIKLDLYNVVVMEIDVRFKVFVEI